MLSKWIKRIIYFLALVAMLIIAIFNVVYINQIDFDEISNIKYYGILNLVTSVIIAGLIIGISYGLEKIKVGKKIKIAFIVIALILYAVIQVFWISQSIAMPYADSEQLMVIAKEIIAGNGLSEYCANYIQYHTQQLTQVSVMVAILKLFHTTSYVVFEYLNVICNVLTVLGLYAITRKIYKEQKWNRILFWLLNLTFIPIVLLVTFVYGDFLGLPFVIWATYFAMRYEKTGKIRNAVVTGVFIAIACLLRMNYFIFAIAIGIYWFINILDKKKKIETAKGLGILVLLVAMILISRNLIRDSYDKAYNLSKEKSFSTIPYLYMGMSEGDYADGWYNKQVGDIVYHLMNDDEENAKKVSDEVTNEFKERVKYLLQNPTYTLKFYAKKIITTWTEPTNEFGFYNVKNTEGEKIEDHVIASHITSGRVYEASKVYQKAIIYIIFVGAIATVIVNRKKLDKEILLLALIFLGGFSFHLLWETKSRYIIPYIIILIPVSVGGIEVIIQKIKDEYKKRKKKAKKVKLLSEKN